MFNLRECNTRLLAEVAQLRHQVSLLGALPQEDACARQHEVSAQTQAKLPQEEAWGQQQGEQSPQPALQQRQVQQPPQKQQKSQHAQQQQQQTMLLSQQGTSLSQQGALLSQPGASQPQLVSPSLRPSQHTQGCLAKPIVKSVGVDAVSCEPIRISVGVGAARRKLWTRGAKIHAFYLIKSWHAPTVRCFSGPPNIPRTWDEVTQQALDAFASELNEYVYEWFDINSSDD